MENFERIEKYQRGRMSPDEARAFEAEMERDEKLADEASLQRFEERAIGLMVEDGLRARVMRLKAEVEEENRKTIKIRRWRIWAVAASITLIGVAIWAVNFSNNKERRYAVKKYMEAPLVLSTSLKGATFDNPNEALAYINIVENHDKKRMGEAVEWFRAEGWQYPLGHALFQNKEFQQAAQVFRQVADRQEDLAAPAAYFELLSLIASGDVDGTAKIILEIKSAKPSHPFLQKVLEIEKENGW